MVDTGFVLQVVLGLAIVFCVFRLSIWLMKKDRLVDDATRVAPDPKHEVRIIDGYAPTALATNRSWSTNNPAARNYASIKRSYNRKGGAQFSYSFWLRLDDTTEANVADKDILVRGETTPFTYTRTDANAAPREITGTMVKCPRIRFGATFDSLVVELNTLDDPDLHFSIDPYAAAAGDVSLRHNLLKLTQGKWTLYTFTFEDNVAINDFEDGIVVRFYVNDMLYQTFRSKSALRQNEGAIYVLPAPSGVTPLANGRIGDLTHYNYALSAGMVRSTFQSGPPTKLASELSGDSDFGAPAFLSEFNKLDMYNA
jgi:hypothetical protein